jgi:hypothetical protein
MRSFFVSKAFVAETWSLIYSSDQIVLLNHLRDKQEATKQQ